MALLPWNILVNFFDAASGRLNLAIDSAVYNTNNYVIIEQSKSQQSQLLENWVWL